MRTVALGLFCLILMGGTAIASNETPTETPQQCDQSLTQDQLDATAPDNEWFHRGYWHCAAFPNHDPHHTHAHHAYDQHYAHAYWRALRECRYYHHSCHVHCHYHFH